MSTPIGMSPTLEARCLIFASILLGSSAARADGPRILVVPFQRLGDGVPAELGEQTTSVLARELVAQGFVVSRAEDKLGESPLPRARGREAPQDPRVLTRVEELLTKGRSDLDEGDFGRAATAFESAATLLEDQATAIADLRLLSEIHLQLGVARFRDRREEEADESLARAVHFDPERILDGGHYPPLFVRVFERARANVLRRPRSKLEIEAPSGAEISMDGRAMGRAPLTLTDVLPGVHWVRAEVAGEPPVVRKIKVAGNTSGSVDLGDSSTVSTASRGVSAAVAGNGLDESHRAQLIEEARATGADFVLLGVMYRTEAAYQVRSVLMTTRSGSGFFGRLVDIAFDLDLLSAEMEVFKLAEDALKESKDLSRPTVATGLLKIAHDYRTTRAPREPARAITVAAAPPPIKAPRAMAAVAGTSDAPNAMKAGEVSASRERSAAGALAVASRSPPPSVTPKDEHDARQGVALVPVASATLPQRPPEEDHPAWWVWALVGVAAAGATVGGSYLLFANRGPEEGNLRISWP